MSKQLKEALLIWVAIFLYCGVMSFFQNKDAKDTQLAYEQELAKLEEPLTRTCIYTHGVDEIHYLNCRVINEKYAKLN